MKSLLKSFLFLGLVGCTATPINFNVQAPMAKKPIQAELKNVNVQANLPEINAPYQTTLAMSLKNSLDKSIEEGKYFLNDSKDKVDISANIEAIDFWSEPQFFGHG